MMLRSTRQMEGVGGAQISRGAQRSEATCGFLKQVRRDRQPSPELVAFIEIKLAENQIPFCSREPSFAKITVENRHQFDATVSATCHPAFGRSQRPDLIRAALV